MKLDFALLWMFTKAGEQRGYVFEPVTIRTYSDFIDLRCVGFFHGEKRMLTMRIKSHGPHIIREVRYTEDGPISKIVNV